MTDDRFEELMRDAAHTYRKAPPAPIDEMWTQIQAACPADQAGNASGGRKLGTRIPIWTAIAATLVIGVGIGRLSTVVVGRTSTAPKGIQTVAVANTTAGETAIGIAPNAPYSELSGAPYKTETSKYLGQTAALLIALPTEVKAAHGADEQFTARASELLSRTRLLIDSPAASDPQMHDLLEDLELVLAQVVRLQNNHSRTELDLINHALEQRDVIPRLRTAVADNSAD